MFSFPFIEGVSMINPPYYILVNFVVSVSCFIAIWVLVAACYQVFFHRGVGLVESESLLVEFLWTFIPTLVVLCLSILNINCIYPNHGQQGLSGVKVIGRQWYWSYGLSDNGGEMYDSVMGDFIDSVDKPLRLESGNVYCLYVTSADVIHSFSVPFLGVKVDAIPGRVNQFPLISDYCGRHVGYCSELCGAGHAYMPIVVEVVPVPLALC